MKREEARILRRSFKHFMMMLWDMSTDEKLELWDKVLEDGSWVNYSGLDRDIFDLDAFQQFKAFQADRFEGDVHSMELHDEL